MCNSREDIILLLRRGAVASAPRGRRVAAAGPSRVARRGEALQIPPFRSKGRASAAARATCTAAASLTAKDPSLDLERKLIVKDSPCFIGVKKGNEDLLRWVNVFILHKKLGGDLNKISQKWLGQDLPPLPSL